MRRLSDEAPEPSPVIEIRERQWMIRNWLFGVLILAILVLSGLIYAGIRVNETREQRNRAVASGQGGQFVADLKDALRRVDERTNDARIVGIATSIAETRLAEAAHRIAALSGNLARLDKEQDELSTRLVTLQQYGDRLSAENEKLRTDLVASSSRIVALQAQRVADSLALAEQNASLNRRLSTVADQTADVDKRLNRSSTTLKGIGGATAAGLAVGMIHLLGTKQASDVKPTSAAIDR